MKIKLNYFLKILFYFHNMSTQSQTVGFYICSYSFLTLLSFIIICFVLCIPVLDIYFGYVFQDEIICQTNLIPINKWLIIKGIFNINYIIISIIFVCSDFKSCMYCLCMPIITIAQIFNFSWLIVGGIVFFRDCPCLLPLEINTYMYFTLIMGIISLFNSNYINSYKKEKHTEKKPMLDV